MMEMREEWLCTNEGRVWMVGWMDELMNEKFSVFQSTSTYLAPILYIHPSFLPK